MMKGESIISVKNLAMAYHENPVIWDINIDVFSGTRTAIIGPNGAGKSTLLKGMLGLMKKLKGNVSFWGESYSTVREKIAYVPQTETVNWNFPITVLDVVMMGRYGNSGLFHRPGKVEREKAINALKEMEMEEYKDRHIADLSGGQKQRVFIARALNQDAELYIMDEPLAGVDKNTENLIIEKFKQLQRENKTVIAVHHEMNTLTEYFDHVVIIDKIVKDQGECNEVFRENNPIEWFKRRG